MMRRSMGWTRERRRDMAWTGRWGMGLIGVIMVLLVPVAARADLPLPLVLRATADLESLQLTIWGVNFGTATPGVRLAGVPMTVLLHTPTEIVVALPTGIEPASYELLVI